MPYRDALSLGAALAIWCGTGVSSAGDHASCAQAAERGHGAIVSRGDHATGFSHETTTHHFRLYKTGGAIEVSANDPKDATSRDQIRMHLAHISKLFAAGDFDIPMFIHATNPPGAALMSQLRDQIRYDYRETDRGAQLLISTANQKAVRAIHDFLLFQITDHRTGDSLDVTAK